MARRKPPPPLTRGVRWRRFVAGRSAAGDTMGEKAYVTPRFPRAIAASALRRAPDGAQRETVIVWFLSNCRRFEPSEPPSLMGVPMGAAHLAGGLGEGHFGAGGFGRSGPALPVVSPGPFAAIYPISLEFGGVVRDDLLSDISNELPGAWVWIPPSSPFDVLGFFDPGEPFMRADLEGRLAGVEAAVRDLRPSYGGIGHNAFGDDPPVTPSEEETLLHDLQQMQADVRAGASRDQLAATWAKVAPYLGKFVTWCGARLTIFIDEGLSKGGATKWVLAAIALSQAGPLIEKLIAKLP